MNTTIDDQREDTEEVVDEIKVEEEEEQEEQDKGKPWVRNPDKYSWFVDGEGNTRPEYTAFENMLRQDWKMSDEQWEIFHEEMKKAWEGWREAMKKDKYNLNWDKIRRLPDFLVETRREYEDVYKEAVYDGSLLWDLLHSEWKEREVFKGVRPTEDTSTLGAGTSQRRQCHLFPKKVVAMGRGSKRTVKVGRGFETPNHYRYFGKLVVSIPALKDNRELVVRTAAFDRVSHIPKQTVSAQFADVLLDCMDTTQVDKDMLLDLNDKERQLFYELCARGGVSRGVGIKRKPTTDDDLDRFELLKSEIAAGNNSVQALLELKYWVLRFMDENVLEREEAYSILTDLAEMLE